MRHVTTSTMRMGSSRDNGVDAGAAKQVLQLEAWVESMKGGGNEAWGRRGGAGKWASVS